MPCSTTINKKKCPTSLLELIFLTLTIHTNREQTTASLPPEDRKQLEEAQRKASTQAANAATGVAGTLGGAVKGVLDTAGNTVTIHPPLLSFGGRQILLYAKIYL